VQEAQVLEESKEVHHRSTSNHFVFQSSSTLSKPKYTLIHNFMFHISFYCSTNLLLSLLKHRTELSIHYATRLFKSNFFITDSSSLIPFTNPWISIIIIFLLRSTSKPSLIIIIINRHTCVVITMLLSLLIYRDIVSSLCPSLISNKYLTIYYCH